MNINWETPPADMILPPGHVDVWRIQLDLPDDTVNSFFPLLDGDEQTRAKKYLSGKKTREYVVTRAALRIILAGILQREPRDLKFACGKNGKPYLADPLSFSSNNRLEFSVSHSYGLALIAFTFCGQVGVDIEKIRADIDHEKLSRRFFSLQEFKALQQFDEKIRMSAFFAAWTRKEAILKATGEGLAAKLKEFDVSTDPVLPPQLLASRTNMLIEGEWFLVTIEADPQYYATLAVKQDLVSKPELRYRYFQASAFPCHNLY